MIFEANFVSIWFLYLQEKIHACNLHSQRKEESAHDDSVKVEIVDEVHIDSESKPANLQNDSIKGEEKDSEEVKDNSVRQRHLFHVSFLFTKIKKEKSFCRW